MLKRTALYECHLQSNARMVPFGGWEMPVQYRGLAEEHHACRQAAALFDVSHMGEIRVKGDKALEFLDGLVTNQLTRIVDGQAQYNVLCQEDGGCVDDIIVHRIHRDEYFLCVNASNDEKDFHWIRDHAPQGIQVIHESAKWSQLALQGPKAIDILRELCSVAWERTKYYWFVEIDLCGIPAFVARTGYTGEDGFEIYVPWDKGPDVWNQLLETGKSWGLQPAGLGARDTLRTEMKFPLYGHEIGPEMDPLSAGLGWVVKFEKPHFIGRDALLRRKELGQVMSSVGLLSEGRGIPRQGYRVERQGIDIGFVTSGTHSPSLGKGIAMAHLSPATASSGGSMPKVGDVLDVVIRDQRVAHRVVPTPFVKPQPRRMI